MKRDLAFLLAIPLLVLWAYAPGIRAPRAYDDAWILERNPRLRDPGLLLRFALDPSSVPPDRYATYRPLGEASFALLRKAGGGVEAQRLLNVGIHVAGAVCVFLVVRRLSSASLARWAALLFALHPMAAQAVTYVYQRFVVLEALLAFACILAYLKGRTWPALALGVLAAGCKETAATLPLALGLLEWVRRDPEEPLGRVLGRWAPYLVLPAFLFVQASRTSASPAWDAPLRHGRMEYLGGQLPMWPHYARLALWPFPMGFYYDRFAPGPGAGMFAAGLAVSAAAAWVLLGPRRHALLRLGLGLWMAPLALECSVFPIPHLGWNFRCYPGLLGTALIFGWGVLRLGRPGRVLGAAALLLMGVLARQENRLWASPGALLRRDVRHAFHDPLVRKCLGCSELDAGRPASAERAFVQAFRSPWRCAPMETGYVSALLSLGKYDEAHARLGAALKVFPDDPDLLWVAVREAERVGEKGRIERLALQASRLPDPGPELSAWLARRRAGAR